MTAMRKSRRLLPGEDPAIEGFDSARRWLTIYEQREALLASQGDSPQKAKDAIAAGLAFWRDRVTELSGLNLDADRRVINLGADREVVLTQRELQLLEFLVQHPHRYFPDHELAVRAWGDQLSGDQVRIYIRRLRLKLMGSGWELVNRRGYGYSLTRPAGDHGDRAPASRQQVQMVVARARALLQVQRGQLTVAMDAARAVRNAPKEPADEFDRRPPLELERPRRSAETVYEELQVTREALESALEELRSDIEVDRLNAFTEGILTTLHAEVAVVDGNGRVALWNSRAEELWGETAPEAVPREFRDLDLGLPMDELGAMVERARSRSGKAEEQIFDAVNRRGRPVRCRALVTPLANLTGHGPGAVVVIQELA
jgi:PAS domain S-box-containing protein